MDRKESANKLANKIFRVEHYKMNLTRSCFGIGIGLGIYLFGGVQSSELDLSSIGFGVTGLSAVACYVYQRKYKRLKRIIEEDTDTLRKGGIVND